MVTLTEETVSLTRQWFANNKDACIEEAVSGVVRVNNLEDYIDKCLAAKEEILAGAWDHTFTFQQRAVYIQTGECHPLLP